MTTRPSSFHGPPRQNSFQRDATLPRYIRPFSTSQHVPNKRSLAPSHYRPLSTSTQHAPYKRSPTNSFTRVVSRTGLPRIDIKQISKKQAPTEFANSHKSDKGTLPVEKCKAPSFSIKNSESRKPPERPHHSIVIQHEKEQVPSRVKQAAEQRKEEQVLSKAKQLPVEQVSSLEKSTSSATGLPTSTITVDNNLFTSDAKLQEKILLDNVKTILRIWIAQQPSDDYSLGLKTWSEIKETVESYHFHRFKQYLAEQKEECLSGRVVKDKMIYRCLKDLHISRRDSFNKRQRKLTKGQKDLGELKRGMTETI